MRAAVLCLIVAMPGLGWANTLVQPTDIGLDTTLDAGASTNAAAPAPSRVEIASITDTAMSGGHLYYRSTTSLAGGEEPLAHLGKDSGVPWSTSDTCLPASGTIATVNGREYRAGPYSVGGTRAGTLPSGAVLTPPAARPVELRILTGPSRASAGANSADYTVTWSYTDMTTSVQMVTIEGGLNATRGGSGTDWTVNAVTPIPDMFLEMACPFNPSYLDEALITNPEPTKNVQDVTLTYGADLRGPQSASFLLTAGAYNGLFTFTGTYESTWIAPSEMENAIWYGVSWTEDVADGDIRLTIQCGDGPMSAVQTGVFSSSSGDSPAAVNPLTTMGPAHCTGTQVQYRAELFADLDTSPELSGITFTYDIDADGDGVGATGVLAAGGTGTPDCLDMVATAFPGATEVYYDGVDADCAGDNDYDQDGDGYVSSAHPGTAGGTAPNEGDCVDTDSGINPAATGDVWYDGDDTDCDGQNDYDRDGDGFVSDAHPGTAGGTAMGEGDCDDNNPGINPGAMEAWYNGLDSNCDGQNDYDRDGDGFVASSHPGQSGGTAMGEGDCDDGDGGIKPDAVEIWYDGVDQNCDGDNDYDQDGDTIVSIAHMGTAGGTAPGEGDCDDTDATVNPMATEIWYDGVDGDCNNANDYDQDFDGFTSASHPGNAGGSAPAEGDCNDSDDTIRPDAVEVCDAIDTNCNGSIADNFTDTDGDGTPDCIDTDEPPPPPETGGCDCASTVGGWVVIAPLVLVRRRRRRR